MSARARVAFDPEWAEYGDGHKLLSDNRDAYIAQSAATRGGNVAPFPIPRPAVATDSPSPNGAAAAGNLSPQEQAK